MQPRPLVLEPPKQMRVHPDLVALHVVAPTSPRRPPRSALRCRTRSSPPCLGASASRTAPSRPPSLGDRSLLRSRQRSSLRHVAPGPRVAGSRVRPRQDRGGVVTFAAVLAPTGCAGIALVLTGWQFLAVHAHVRTPPAPYWVRAPLPRTIASPMGWCMAFRRNREMPSVEVVQSRIRRGGGSPSVLSSRREQPSV